MSIQTRQFEIVGYSLGPVSGSLSGCGGGIPGSGFAFGLGLCFGVGGASGIGVGIGGSGICVFMTLLSSRLP